MGVAPARIAIIVIGLLQLSIGGSDAREPTGEPRNDPPQIPKQDFEWNGRFQAQDLGVDTDLTIRGKWQAGYFDLYMQQGHEGAKAWVENLIYRNKLYTITHEWPASSPGTAPEAGGALCFQTVNDITVDDLNDILRSSRLVGLEVINAVAMNHFRATCLSGIVPLVRLHIFSDLYVRPDRPTQLERWLQFGDGVGLDPQQDEWFFLDEHNNHPQGITLPNACRWPIPVFQKPCSNLSSPSE